MLPHTVCSANISLYSLLNYEQQDHMSITVSVRDVDGLFLAAVWNIEIINKNDAPLVRANLTGFRFINTQV